MWFGADRLIHHKSRVCIELFLCFSHNVLQQKMNLNIWSRTLADTDQGRHSAVLES